MKRDWHPASLAATLGGVTKGGNGNVERGGLGAGGAGGAGGTRAKL